MRIDSPVMSNAVITGSISGSFVGDVTATTLDLSGQSLVSGSEQIVLENADKTGFTGASSITTLGTVASGDVSGVLPSGTVSGSGQVVLNDADKTGFTGASSITTLGTVSSGDVAAILPSGTVSGSAQIVLDNADKTGFNTDDVSEGTNQYYTDAKVKTKLDAEAVISGSTLVQAITFNGANSFNGNNNFGGLQTFNNINVNGTGSFAYIQQVTGSAKLIGDAFIVLNSDSPAERYAGVKVFDSGSSASTASLQFDSVSNDWFYEYEDGTVDYGIALFGPEYNTKGSPTYLSNNTIPKGDGGHHLNDSNITDNGTTITLGSNTEITGTVSATGTSLFSGSIQVDHDAATNFVANEHIDHTSVSLTAGDGLTGGGDISASRTFAVGAGTGIDVAADAISVDVSDFMTNGANNRVVTATGTDAMNAESGLTYDGSNLDVTGGVRATGEVTAFYSDERLKDFKGKIEGAVDKIQGLNGYYYTANDVAKELGYDSDDVQVGLSAQEVESVLPEVVTTAPIDDKYLTVKYEKLVALLVEGIKEQQGQIEQLENRIKELENSGN